MSVLTYQLHNLQLIYKEDLWVYIVEVAFGLLTGFILALGITNQQAAVANVKPRSYWLSSRQRLSLNRHHWFYNFTC